MKFGPRRGHFLSIFERFFRDFGLLILAVTAAIILQDWEFLLNYMGLVVLVLFAPIKRLADYLFTYYSIFDEKLLIEKGWINKKRVEIPLANITTVDFAQNIIFQIASVYSVNVVNASEISNSGSSAKATLTLKVDDALLVKKLLLPKQDQADETLQNDRISEDCSGNTISAALGDIFLMGLLQSKAVIVLQLLGAGSVLVSVLARVFAGKTVDGEQLIVDFFFSLSGPLTICGIILLLYLVGIFVSVGVSVVRYYGFRINNREDSIFIEYGLLTRKTFTLMKDKISGVNYKQSLLMRIFGRGVLEVFAIGYGNNASGDEEEISVLFPLLGKRGLNQFIGKLIPEFGIPCAYTRAERKALPYFFMCARIVWALIFLMASIAATRHFMGRFSEIYGIPLIILGVLLVLLAVISVVLEYFNAGIYGTMEQIGLTCGGFKKSSVFIRTEKVESIREKASNRKRRKKGISTITLGILAPAAVAKQKVRNLSLETFEEIKKKLIY